MKKIMRYGVVAIVGVAIHMQAAAQQGDERMRRDIEVAENVLSTLIKQEISPERTYFGLEVQGNYQQGYGVTFRVPGDYSMPFIVGGVSTPTAIYAPAGGVEVITYAQDAHGEAAPAKEKADVERKRAREVRAGSISVNRSNSIDSIREEYYKSIVAAATNFIVDYGDFMSQLTPNERIIVTNQPERSRYWFSDTKRTHIQVEGTKADVTAFKQGKITRNEAVKRLKVVNTETVDVREKDMELLASIFNRLYRSDLSTTYFTENNTYYERLKDYGVIFYMQVYSSTGEQMKVMPTQGNEIMDEAARNKRVTELYPKFEQELKENILEYGRTISSLKDNETLVFNVTLTKCGGCGIPSTVELAIKQSVLKDYSAGTIDKNAALSQFSVRKGPNQ